MPSECLHCKIIKLIHDAGETDAHEVIASLCEVLADVAQAADDDRRKDAAKFSLQCAQQFLKLVYDGEWPAFKQGMGVNLETGELFRRH